MMFKQTIKGLALVTLIASSSMVLAEGARKAMITPELYSFTVEHDGEPIEVMRNQNPDNKVHELYNTTFRGMPQPIHPFEPHDVETIGEREFVALMQAAQKDENILIVDTRTEGWHYRLTIPGSVNVPFTVMKEEESAADALDDFGVVKNADGSYDFAQAKTLAMFCNGYWCGQTPTLIRALLEKDYPADKMKYYRGGMQAWTSLGLTTVGDAE
ncbi:MULTISPECIES: rhodanese-like domain-containing protein [unclassified Neptuniibacter]|uniref:rhodanese-like domain-containing protein n=2 Tax=Neptuniibacter TaxID=459520 RepID=UPI0025FF6F85|nr:MULTISPECIES: rhodanese-like domain-containing protein [unclassified Neptuniibacter]|tara:strand:- start:27548 stop:28189 length:642 start_codon:yes stop_codon:yes gene_type:complete